MAKRNDNLIVGLDIGTTKICAIAGQLTDDGVEIVAASSNPSSGLRKGVVIDIEAAAGAIRKAIAGITEQTGLPVEEAYVGIAGSHIKSFNSYGAAGIKGREVTRADVDRAIESASSMHMPGDRETIHVLPTDFILDGQAGIKDPVGMTGSRLEVKVYIITGAMPSVQNLLKCCERAGIDVIDIVLQPLASSEATLTDEERDMGIALVDIGGGTTDIAVYKDGWLAHTSVIGIGGNHVTNDISVGLRLSFQEAERIKKVYGSAMLSDINDTTEVDAVSIDGQVRGIPRKYLIEVIHPRANEMIEIIGAELTKIQEDGTPVSGVVLTGGASLLKGMGSVAEAVLAMPVRIGYPSFSTEQYQHGMSAGEYNSPVYSTGVGLVMYAAQAVGAAGASGHLVGRMMSAVTGWLRSIVGK